MRIIRNLFISITIGILIGILLNLQDVINIIDKKIDNSKTETSISVNDTYSINTYSTHKRTAWDTYKGNSNYYIRYNVWKYDGQTHRWCDIVYNYNEYWNGTNAKPVYIHWKNSLD